MRKTLFLLVVLGLLLGILTGCELSAQDETNDGKASAETTQATETRTEPEVETEPGPKLEDFDPPRTPEDFLFQLNLYMKENSVPLKFSFGERKEDVDTNWVLCSPFHTGEGPEVNRGNVELWLQYTGDESGILNTVRVSFNSQLEDSSPNYFRMLSIAASTICDDAMSEESAAKLYDSQWEGKSIEEYPSVVFNEDGVGFAIGSEPIPDMENHVQPALYRFSQPDSILHCYKKLLLERYPEWEVVFLENAEPPKSLTVQELEDCINAYFAAKGLPLECAFALSNSKFRRYDSEVDLLGVDYSSTDGLSFRHSDLGYAEWRARFRFTSWDDPNIQYPVPNLMENTIGYCDDPEYYERCIYEQFAFLVVVNAKGVDADASIYEIHINRPRMTGMPEPWDESWRVLYQDLVTAVCDLWTQETGSTVLRDATDELFASGDGISIDTEDYSVRSRVSSDGQNIFSMEYFPGRWWLMEEAAPILDPQRLDYKFTYNEPVVQDGLFFESDDYIDRYRFRTDIYGESDFYHNVPESLNEYLSFTGSLIQVDTYFDTYRGHLYTITDVVGERTGETTYRNSAHKLDQDFFNFEAIDLVPFDYVTRIGLGEEMFCLYYSETASCPVDIDYLIAAAIGLSQITDEEMTVEEAFDLHLTEQEVALTAGDWQISYTAPREVAHIICKNPATGMTRYYVLPLELFQTEYGSLETFAASMYLA